MLNPTIFAGLYPHLYHMAEPGSWPGIQKHGLLSTSALLDLFEVSGDARVCIETKHRGACVPIEHPQHGRAVVRDQLPMSDAGLVKALRDGLTPSDWYTLLNNRVFFWVNEARLNTLLGARAYRTRRQTVLVLDTRELLAVHASDVELSPYNSGSTKPNPFPRGLDCFLPIERYPFEQRRRLSGRKDAVVELTVKRAVPTARDFVLIAKEVGGGKDEEILWRR